MAHKILHVGYRWIKTAPDVDKLAPQMSAVSDDWVRLNVHIWFLWTTKSPAEVYEGLRDTLTKEDGVFVAPIDPSVLPHGWAPQFIWDWFKDKAKLVQLGL